MKGLKSVCALVLLLDPIGPRPGTGSGLGHRAQSLSAKHDEQQTSKGAILAESPRRIPDLPHGDHPLAVGLKSGPSSKYPR